MRSLTKWIGLAAAVLGLVAGAVVETEAGVVIEGFESGNLSQYVNSSGGTVSSAYAHDGSYGLSTDSGAWLYRTDSAVQLAQGDRFSVWVQFDSLLDGRAYFGFGASSGGALSLVLAPNTQELAFQENPNFNFNSISTVSQSYQVDKWYKAEVDWGVGGSLTGRLYDSDGTTLLNTITANSSLFTAGGIAFRGFSGVKAFDTVILENAVAAVPEPSMLISGATAGLLGLGYAWRRRKTA